ncbi:hypothetical protein [Maridesulfovibrio sp.]|uniref:hypothetical protein n=1 Tax=Maridesulfovibrio sp. TaxID=2795000 RepID=UPI0029CA4FB6|nr:hypothetical protein [Maridesulfovibrio sp.]
MPQSSRLRVYVDPDLFDLVPVLKKSLSSDLCDIADALNSGNYESIRESGHSSLGAAMTYGFDSYADELTTLRQAALDQNEARLWESLARLKALLENSVFVPAV